MQYNPKLKKAMQEIESIIKKNNIAGFVVLNDGVNFSEYLNAISPSFSCASVVNNGIEFSLKSSLVGREEAKRMAEGTYNMITHLAELIGRHAVMYIDAQELLKKEWGGEDDGDSFTSSHIEQNN